MLAQDISIPVYFVKHTSEFDSIITEVSQSVDTNDMSKSAAEALLNLIAANGYQIVVSTSNPSANTDAKIATVQGHLLGYSPNGKISTVAIVAHYDSFGVAPVSIYHDCWL